MLNLFEKYKASGKIEQALFVGQNLFSKNPGDDEVFYEYFLYLCKLAKSLPYLEDRKRFAKQADAALNGYKQNAELDEIKIEQILNYQNKIEEICRSIDDEQRYKDESASEETYRKNDSYIERLFILKEELICANSKGDFDTALRDIDDTDSLIDVHSLSLQQKNIYNSLMKERDELISAKLKDFGYEENADYDENAAYTFADALKMFRENDMKCESDIMDFA